MTTPLLTPVAQSLRPSLPPPLRLLSWRPTIERGRADGDHRGCQVFDQANARRHRSFMHPSNSFR